MTYFNVFIIIIVIQTGCFSIIVDENHIKSVFDNIWLANILKYHDNNMIVMVMMMLMMIYLLPSITK